MTRFLQQCIAASTLGLAALAASGQTSRLAIDGTAEVGATVVAFGQGTTATGGPYVMPPGSGAFTVDIADPFFGVAVGSQGTISSFATASTAPITPFMTFTGSPITLTGSVAAGQVGPFFAQDTNFGVVASFNVSGSVLSGTTEVGTYTGTFAATFTGIDSATLMSELAAGELVAHAYAASFVATPVPEPATAGLLLAGLIGIGALVRRRS